MEKSLDVAAAAGVCATREASMPTKGSPLGGPGARFVRPRGRECSRWPRPRWRPATPRPPPSRVPRRVRQPEEKSTMSTLPVRLALATSLVVTLATLAAAQAPGTACTSPLDPACDHLKCYQIKDTPITAKVPLLQLDNQFGREVVFRLQPVFLCVPTQKSCCKAGACSPSNCNPNPVPAP